MHRFLEHRFPQSLSMAVSKIADLIYQAFCLGLLRPFAVSFYLCTTETTHSRDNAYWYSAISSSVFSILIDFAILTPPNLNFFSTSMFSEIYYTFFFFFLIFLFKLCDMFISNFWLVKNTCSTIFREKITYD